MVSYFNPNITSDIEFLNKGVNPKYGERISSVINISTSNNVAEKFNEFYKMCNFEKNMIFDIINNRYIPY